MKVGTSLRIIGESEYAGRVGTLIEDDGSGLPYLVQIDNNRSWFRTSEVQRVRKTRRGLVTVESDPNGIAANAPGAKLDAGKPRPALVLGSFSRALEEVVKIGTFGATKYTPRGWLEVPNGEERYADAAWRHQLKVWKGEELDDGEGGTGGLHKAQVIWNLLAELELELRRKQA